MKKALAVIAFMIIFGYITLQWASLRYDTFVIALAILIGSYIVNMD